MQFNNADAVKKFSVQYSPIQIRKAGHSI